MYSGTFIDDLLAAVTRAEEHAEFEVRMQQELREAIDRAISAPRNVSEPVAIQRLSVA